MRGSEEKITKNGLWAYAFGFWPIRALGGSSAVVVFAFVDAHKDPTFVVVYAAAWQLDFFLVCWSFLLVCLCHRVALIQDVQNTVLTYS
jgi:hypothetical protein